MLCFFRLCFPQIGTQTKVKQILAKVPQFVKSYIISVSGIYFEDVVMRSDFEKVIYKCSRHPCVCIEGPKICGKTYTLVLFFALSFQQPLNCLLLTS